MLQEPLVYFSAEKWSELQTALRADWLRSISGYSVLETQLRWKERGFKYGFQVFCPLGDPNNGFVAVNEKLTTSVTFGLLSPEHIELIDSKWPHRYPSSTWYFELLIKTESGYGLYENGKLISWIFLDECGKLTHLYTLEDHRRKGYAELVLKLISNELLKKKKHVLAFALKENVMAHSLYQKIGFKKVKYTDMDVTWAYLKRKSNSLQAGI